MMSRGKASYSRRVPSLRLYFDDIAVETNYTARMNERLINEAERNLFVAEDGDIYKEIPKRHTETNISLNTTVDEVDNRETMMQKLLDEVKRGFPRNHRRRRVPKLRFNGNTIPNILNTADTRNSRLFVIIDAIERDDDEKLRELIQCGSNPNLEYTLTTRQAEDLRCIIGTFQVEEQATWTILHEASSRGHVDCVRVLLEAGADPNVVAVKNLTVLDVAGSTYHYNHSQMREGLVYTVSRWFPYITSTGRDHNIWLTWHKVRSPSLKAVTKILLEAGGKFNTMKGRNDANLDTALHTAAEIKSIETVKLLLEAGASVACLNTAGLTPLHICLQTKSVEVLDILVNHNCKDISQKLERVDVTDKYGFTVLQGSVILNWIPGFRVILEAGGQLTYSAKHSKSSLWKSPKWYQLLQSRHTPIHLAVARNNVEILDMMLSKILEIDALNCFNQECETPLHTAIKHGHLSCVKMLVFEGASISKVSVKNCSALHVAAEYDQTEILTFLLEYKDETEHIINALNKQGVAPLHCAVMNNNPECVTILLINRADIRQRTLGHNSLTPLHIAASYNYTDVTSVILHHDKTTIDEIDNRGFSPLHAAANNCCHNVILLLLKQGASLSSCTQKSLKGTKTAIDMIANKLPNPTSFFEEIFDSFISSKDTFGMTQINVNYEVLGKAHEGHQMKILEELVNCGQEKVLIHPFLESLIYLKWRTLLPFFYIVLATYVFFVVSLNILIVSAFYYNDKHKVTSILFHQTSWANIVYISICSLLVQEFFYINVKRARYFYYVETWVKLGSIALAAILAGTICDSSWSESEWPRHVATMALIASWVEIMFLVSRFPRWGYYVLMFGSVSVTIIKILITFFFLVIAFSFSFMIQFQSTPPFDGLAASLLKTIVMMTSEFDYASFDNNFKLLSSSTTVVRLLFLFFLLFVSIVFMNFMVGVAVSDINNLNIQGNTKRLGKLVELLSTLEVVVHDGPLRKIIPRKTFDKIENRRFLREISTFPGSEKTWSIIYGDKADNLRCEANRKVRLPISLGNAIMDKAKVQKQLIDEENVSKAYLDKIDLLYQAVTSVKPLTRPIIEYHMSVLNAKFEKIMTDMKKNNEMLKQDLSHALNKMEGMITKS